MGLAVIEGLIAAAVVAQAVSGGFIAYAAWRVTRFMNEPEEKPAEKPKPVRLRAVSPVDPTMPKPYEPNPETRRASMASLRAAAEATLTEDQKREKRVAEFNG